MTDITLLVTPTLTAHLTKTDRVPFPNEPTWARVVTAVGQNRRVHLDRLPDNDDGLQRWRVPPWESSPGDHIEIGPLPDHVAGVDIALDYEARNGGTRW